MGRPRDGEAADDHKNLKQLLNDLMDFNTAVQSYVMAAHSIRYDKMVKSGVQVRKLFIDLAKDMRPELRDALIKSMDALEDAASSFSTMFNDLSRRCRKNRKLSADLLQKQQDLKQRLEEAQHTTNAAEVKMREAEDKAKAADARLQVAHDVERLAAARMVDVSKKQDELDKRERQLRAEMRTAEVQNNLMMANVRATTDAQLQEMQYKINVALQRTNEADKERQIAHNKSCQLAEQMQQMQQRLKGRKKGAGSGPFNGLGDEADATNRRLKALEARNKAMEEQLMNLGIATPEHRLARDSKYRTTGDSIDLTRSSSPLSNIFSTSPATPLDGFEFMSQASATAAAAAASNVSPSVQRKGSKRTRFSLSVEPERLDDEMDEAHYPVPGFGGLQMPGPLSKSSMIGQASTTSRSEHAAARATEKSCKDSTSAAATPLSTINQSATPKRTLILPTATSNKKRKRASTPSATSSTSTTSSTVASTTKTGKPNQHNWLHKTNGIVLGPKRRSKAS